MKKLIGFIITLTLLIPGIVSASADSTTGRGDVRNIHSYYLDDLNNTVSQEVYRAVTDLIQANIITGYEDHTFRPNLSITRAEFIKLLVEAAELQADGTGKTFTDVKPNVWYSESIRIASSLGIINGDASGTFRPNEPITRIEIAKILTLTFKETVPASGEEKAFTDVNGWEQTYSKLASSMGIINGNTDGTFKPKDTAKRGHAILMLHRALQLETSDKQDETLVVSRLKDAYNDTYGALAKIDYKALEDATNRYGIGFYSQALIFLSTVYASMQEDGNSMKVELVGQPAFRIVSISKRYATVEASGYSEKRTIMLNGLPYTDTSPRNDLIYLKKIGDNWFVYGTKANYENVHNYLELLH